MSQESTLSPGTEGLELQNFLVLGGLFFLKAWSGNVEVAGAAAGRPWGKPLGDGAYYNALGLQDTELLDQQTPRSEGPLAD